MSYRPCHNPAAYDASVEKIKSANTVLRETLDDLA